MSQKKSPQLKCHKNWNITKTEMSQNTEMSWKTDVAPKLKCYQNWNFTLTEMLQNVKISSKWNLNQNKIQEICTDHLGLVQIYVSSHRAKFLSKTFWSAYSWKLNQTLGEAIQKKTWIFGRGHIYDLTLTLGLTAVKDLMVFWGWLPSGSMNNKPKILHVLISMDKLRPQNWVFWPKFNYIW